MLEICLAYTKQLCYGLGSFWGSYHEDINGIIPYTNTILFIPLQL